MKFFVYNFRIVWRNFQGEKRFHEIFRIGLFLTFWPTVYYKVWKKNTCSAIYVIFFQKKVDLPRTPRSPLEPSSQPPPPPNLLSTSTPPPPPLGLEPTTLCVVDWCLRPLGHRGCYKSRQEFIYIRFICRRFNSYFKIHTNKYEFLKYENIILKIFQSIKL